jgi:cytochrome c biogenesis protein CcdA/thiol-disulfide isomerase/thioredoxin
MAILILFAFLGGVITILSPCILPVLPVVLSGGIGGEKDRPIGIVSGFVASFTAFTLTLTAIVQATGISANSIRYFAVALIIVFGLILILPRLHEWFALKSSRIAALAHRRNSTGADDPRRPRTWLSGYAGGLLIGVGLGLVWTPCVGPIMASVISLALTEKINGGALAITLAYSVGTALPMLGIMLGGRAMLDKVPALLRNTEKIQRVFGVLVIITGIGIGLGWDRRLQAAILRAFPEYGSGLTAIENTKPVQESLAILDPRAEDSDTHSGKEKSPAANALLGDFGPAPEILTNGRWYNTEGLAKGTMPAYPSEGSPPLTMRQLRGKVILVDFWTYSCVNCVRTLPHLAAWYRAYRKDGLVIIGIHTPEFEFEKDPANVKKAITDLGVTWPVVLDNQYKEWQAYSNRYWPAHYFIDAEGRIRYRHFGEGEYDTSERVIKALLKEAGAASTVDVRMSEQSIESLTPETYLGYGRAAGFVSDTKMVSGSVAEYKAAGLPENGEWNLSGKWTVTKEYIVPENEGSLHLGFDAKNVFLVVEPESREGKIEIRVDGVPAGDTHDVKNGVLHPRESRLYQLVALDIAGPHVLTLDVIGKLRLFAFTFG